MGDKRGPYRKPFRDLCIRCGSNPRRPGRRWCADCHAAYQRTWRKARAQAITESGLFAKRLKVPFNP